MAKWRLLLLWWRHNYSKYVYGTVWVGNVLLLLLLLLLCELYSNERAG